MKSKATKVILKEIRFGPQTDEHDYEWRLHGNGGGDSGGEYAREGNLARWTRPGGCR